VHGPHKATLRWRETLNEAEASGIHETVVRYLMPAAVQGVDFELGHARRAEPERRNKRMILVMGGEF
jgi:hypothetical protein